MKKFLKKYYTYEFLNKALLFIVFGSIIVGILFDTEFN
ncbi:hypothetical protein MNB_SV-14-559 [hydrothermal vent metagenome]|uniref:Uncharacterized protein n=1 Tax=hydrothermal vent metagenome TaxID=652676 RepID=A0A1W1BFS4_9ZZZZ